MSHITNLCWPSASGRPVATTRGGEPCYPCTASVGGTAVRPLSSFPGRRPTLSTPPGTSAFGAFEPAGGWTHVGTTSRVGGTERRLEKVQMKIITFNIQAKN